MKVVQILAVPLVVVGAVASVFGSANWYFSLPIMQIDADTKQCVRIILVEGDQEKKYSCKAISLTGKYLTEYVHR